MPIDMAQLQFQGEHGRDEFKREAVAAKVISLLASPVAISPMVIDGDWGTGKTEFCHKLINKFKVEHGNYKLIYVDAFQADHADDPLMTILAEVIKLLPEGEQRQGFIQKALPVARYGLKTLLKAGAGHILRQDAGEVAEGLEEHLKDAANKVIDASVEAVLKDHEKAEESLKALQEALANIAADSPIVLFIDELDRCRPDFAVQMLEVIKHTFDVEGVQFVLVTNTTQLKAAINHCYGQGVDAQRYLDKFLKFNFELPKTIGRHGLEQELASIEHFANLISRSEVLTDTKLQRSQNGEFGFVESLIRSKRLSLREVETFVRHLEIYHTLTDRKGLAANIMFGYQLLRIFGVLAFCFNPEVARSFNGPTVDAVAIADLMGVEKMPEVNFQEYQYPEHFEVVAVVLARECQVNKELFTSDDDEVNRWWNTTFNRYFELSAPRQGDRLAVAVEVIDVLGLKNL